MKTNKLKLWIAFLLPRWLVYLSSARLLNEALDGDFSYKTLRHMRFTTALKKWRIQPMNDKLKHFIAGAVIAAVVSLLAFGMSNFEILTVVVDKLRYEGWVFWQRLLLV